MQRPTNTLLTSTAAVAKVPQGNFGTAPEGRDDRHSSDDTNSKDGDHRGRDGDRGGGDRRDDGDGDAEGDDASCDHGDRLVVAGSHREPVIAKPAWPSERPGIRLLDHRGLEEKGIRYSKAQLWRLVKAGTFPRPIRLGAARSAWVEGEVDAWIAERIAERDTAAKSV